MGFLIPTWQLKEGAVTNFRHAVLDVLIFKALRMDIGNDQSELKIDDLTPADLGLKSWDIILPQDSRAWIKGVIEPQKLIGIYKVIQLAKWSKINAMVIEQNDITSYYSMAQLYIYGQEGFFSEPHIIDSSIKISIEVDENSKNEERLVLGGFVVSKWEKGK